jgi:hypothetical protein
MQLIVLRPLHCASSRSVQLPHASWLVGMTSSDQWVQPYATLLHLAALVCQGASVHASLTLCWHACCACRKSIAKKAGVGFGEP